MVVQRNGSREVCYDWSASKPGRIASKTCQRFLTLKTTGGFGNGQQCFFYFDVYPRASWVKSCAREESSKLGRAAFDGALLDSRESSHEDARWISRPPYR